MKHFFYPYDPDQVKSKGGAIKWLTSMLLEDPNEDVAIEDEISERMLSEESCLALKQKNETYCKVYFDMTDIIFDKRLEGEDEELKKVVSGENEFAYLKKVYQESEKEDVDEGSQYYRISALKMLWAFIEKKFSEFKIDQKTPGKNLGREDQILCMVLYHLTRGNLALRISQCYADNYDYKESDLWGSHAIEILWHGKNLAAPNRNGAGELDIYHRLIKLNIAKYYREYAHKNRRSDYSAAMDEFRHVRKRVGEFSGKSFDRQYSMIWLDAVINIAEIHRRRFNKPEAHRQLLRIYLQLYAIIEQKLGKDFSESVHLSHAQELAEQEMSYYENQYKFQRRENHDFQEIGQAVFSSLHMELYDYKRYLLLMLLDLGRIRREMGANLDPMSSAHDFRFEKYRNALVTYFIANYWSNSLDNNPIEQNFMDGYNIDSLNGISSVLRKLVSFAKGDEWKELFRKFSVDNISLFPSVPSELNQQIASVFMQKLLDCANNQNLNSKVEVIKWYWLCQENHAVNRVIGHLLPAKTIDDYLTEENGNKLKLHLLFFKGVVRTKEHKFSEAIEIFNRVISYKEAQYIRLGTIGLKAHYKLATCYMAQTDYMSAERILEDVHNRLALALESRKADRNILPDGQKSSDADKDSRVEIDLGYCYMQRGDFKKALQIYEDLYGVDDIAVLNVKESRNIMGLNNYAACCIFSLNKKRYSYCKRIKKIFDKIRELVPEKHESDPETNLLKGFYTISVGETPDHELPSEDRFIDNIDRSLKYASDSNSLSNNWDEYSVLLKAQYYFEKACGYENAFTSHYPLLTDGEVQNKADYRNEVERVSVYVINQVKLYFASLKYKAQDSEESGETREHRKKIERFILGIPNTFSISLKAAIALGEWLLYFESIPEIKRTDKERDIIEAVDEPNSKLNLGRQMYRSFSYLTIYKEERGASAFNSLKGNRDFRLFNPEDRGKLLALLLSLYKPIKAIKEESCYNIDDYNVKGKLVHYTSLNVLQEMLKKETSAETLGSAENGYFRISNCGNMNDVFEGTVFLDVIQSIIEANSEILDIDGKAFDNIRKKYFPQINRLKGNMIPGRSNVYIGSLSVKEDSFPLWSIYADNEKGCSIEFGQNFFDIDGAPYNPKKLREYMMSKYSDNDYPLYIVHYIGEEIKKHLEFKQNQEIIGNEAEIYHTKPFIQHCGTASLKHKDLIRLFTQIIQRWKRLDSYVSEIRLSSAEGDDVQVKKDVIYAFTADRINEIRFLFKDEDYDYEGEVRVVYTATDNELSDVIKIDNKLEPPRIYVNVNREISDLTIRLGSRIEDADVDLYVTWLKHTQKVRQVELARRNRYTV